MLSSDCLRRYDGFYNNLQLKKMVEGLDLLALKHKAFAWSMVKAVAQREVHRC